MTAMTTTPPFETFSCVEEKAANLVLKMKELMKQFPGSFVVFSTIPDTKTTPGGMEGRVVSKALVCNHEDMQPKHHADLICSAHGCLEIVEDHMQCEHGGEEFRIALDDSFTNAFPFGDDICFIDEEEVNTN